MQPKHPRSPFLNLKGGFYINMNFVSEVVVFRGLRGDQLDFTFRRPGQEPVVINSNSYTQQELESIAKYLRETYRIGVENE